MKKNKEIDWKDVHKKFVKRFSHVYINDSQVPPSDVVDFFKDYLKRQRIKLKRLKK